MKIAIGGMQKNEMDFAIKKAMLEVETVLTNDMAAVKMLKNGEVDYYFGACESGGGSAISILIGLMGYSKCCTVCKNGGKLNKAEFVKEGKLCFGMTVSNIEGTVPVLLEVLAENQK
jgi:hypothetical protein